VSATTASKSATCRASAPSPVSSVAATAMRRVISPASAASPRTGPASSAATASNLATEPVAVLTRLSSLLTVDGALLVLAATLVPPLAAGVLVEVEVIRVWPLLRLATGLTRAPLLPMATTGAMLQPLLWPGKSSHQLLSRRLKQLSVACSQE